VLDDNVCPCCVDPEITGTDTNDGATTVGVPAGAGATTAVGVDTAEAAPHLLDAVTFTCIVAPTSADANAYDCAVAPATGAQLLPAESQRCH
jgi:hypothetical protein